MVLLKSQQSLAYANPLNSSPYKLFATFLQQKLKIHPHILESMLLTVPKIPKIK